MGFASELAEAGRIRYKHRWKAIAWRSRDSVRRRSRCTDSTRTAARYHLLSSRKREGRMAVSVADLRCSCRLHWRRYSGSGGAKLWTGCASSYGRGLLVVLPNRQVKKQMRTSGTTTCELVQLREWLQAEGCTHVAMESTGVYWKPVYAILEGALEMLVANAQHIKRVPGHKTDVKDAEWIADLLVHGLLKPSFVPPPPIRELRDLTRYRRKLVESQSAEPNRLLKVLETANIKLSSVASDVFGVSGRLMLAALVQGEATPPQMAELAKGKLRDKIPQLELALEGRFQEHHRYLLKLQLKRLQAVEDDLAQLEARIQQKLQPYQEQFERLQ